LLLRFLLRSDRVRDIKTCPPRPPPFARGLAQATAIDVIVGAWVELFGDPFARGLSQATAIDVIVGAWDNLFGDPFARGLAQATAIDVIVGAWVELFGDPFARGLSQATAIDVVGACAICIDIGDNDDLYWYWLM
jgi:hypothetical protein